MKRTRLQVRDSVGSRVVPIEHTPFTIGRSSTSDLQLVSTDASRNHAEISIENDLFTIRDRESRFGTFVNGHRVATAPLSSGDRIQLGRSSETELVFLTGDDEVAEETFGASARDDIRQLGALLEGLRALGSGRVLEEVLALVLDAAIDITGAERAFIMLNSAGQLEFRLARGRGKVTLTSSTFVTSRKIPEEVFRTGETRLVADLLDADTAALHQGTIALGIRNVICVPLNVVRYLDRAEASTEDQRIGVLYLDGRDPGRLLSAAGRSGLEALAAEACVAIENARLYREALDKSKLEQEIRIAAQIQQALLPKSHFLARFIEAAATTLPCRSIGADFFDYAGGDKSAFSFVVGDVAGKGPPAALLSALMQGMCALFLQDAEEPAIAVASMNKALHQRDLESRYVTLFYGVLSPDGELTYCNAGFNAPLVIGPTGVRRLESGGAVVGLLEFANYEQETVQLDHGDTVVVSSDGVLEALNAGEEEFGEARVQAEVERSPGADPSALVERITAGVRTFADGATQNDDLTVMVIRYGADSGAAPPP